MVEAAGLQDAKMCVWWQALHTALKSELPVSEKPAVVDLLHAGAICTQLTNRGFSLKVAVAHAAEDVYVSTKRNSTTKQVRSSSHFVKSLFWLENSFPHYYMLHHLSYSQTREE